MHTALVNGVASAERAWFGYWGIGWPWGLLWFGFAVLFWGGLIALLVWAVRSVSAPRRGSDTAAQILKRRLAHRVMLVIFAIGLILLLTRGARSALGHGQRSAEAR